MKMLKLVKNLKSKKSGFTLIELIVVIAILGLLAAILVPSMVGIVNSSKQGVAEANARSVYSAAASAYSSTSLTGGKIEPKDYDNDDTDPFITAVKTNLGSGFTGTYTITVGDGGVTKVVFKGTNDQEGTYTPSSASSTAVDSSQG